MGDCPPDSVVDWDNFAKGFLQTQCTQCHSSLYTGDNRRGAPEGVNFNTYAGAYQWRDRIVARAVGEVATMPPAGGTTDEDQALLLEWVACGAPGSDPAPDSCEFPVVVTGDFTLSSAEDVQDVCSQGNTLSGSVDVTGTDIALDCICSVDGALDLTNALGFFSALNLQQVGAGVVLDNSNVSEVRLPALTDIGVLPDSETTETTGTSAPGTSPTETTASFSLPSLLPAGGGLSVQGNSNLSDLDLSALVRVGGDIVVQQNSVLSTLDLSMITTINGHLVIDTNPMLTTIDVVRLRWVLADFVVANNPLVGGLETTESVDTIIGNVQIVNNDSIAFLGAFQNATWIGGAIDILDNDSLVDISGFTYIYDLFQPLSIIENAQLFQVPGFQNVGYITGNIVLTDNPKLERLAGFVNLYVVDGTIQVERNPELWDLNGFEQISEIGGLFVSGSEDLGAQASFETLQVVHGDLSFIGNPGLLAFTEVAFASLHTVEGDLQIQQCPDLEGLEGFMSLTDVWGNVAIGDNDSLAEIVGLPGLQNVGGNFRLFNNASMDNVSGIGSLDTVTGNFDLTNNALLTSIVPLYSLTGVGADLLCTDNGALPTSQCNTLVSTIGASNIGGTVTVSGNGPG